MRKNWFLVFIFGLLVVMFGVALWRSLDDSKNVATARTEQPAPVKSVQELVERADLTKVQKRLIAAGLDPEKVHSVTTKIKGGK